MSEQFELLKPRSATQLHDNLVKLLSNRKHVDSIIVDETAGEIRIDLSRMANAFGNSDFRLKLKSGKTDEARAIINRLKSQDAPSTSQSHDLFEMLAVF